MVEVNLSRLRAHQNNIDRYRRLLATRLSDLEREYIERRLGEEQGSLKAILHETFPDRLSGRLPGIEGRTTDLEMDALLHPSGAFRHPMDVIDDPDLTSYEKRAILSSWALDVCAVPGSSRPVHHAAVGFDDILDALRLLESEPEPATDRGNGSRQNPGAQGPDTLSLDF